MSPLTLTGILGVIVLITGVGWVSGKQVKTAKDFLSGGGQAGAFLVGGAILGSLVSSQATIGTAQLAFSHGLSAWWFTLGSGAGCLVLAVGYADRLRQSGCNTVFQVLSKEYGARASGVGSALCSIGIFISVLAQVVACCGLITALFPSVSLPAAAACSIVVMGVYVLFGGSWGAGLGGIVKLVLLCVAAVSSLLYVLTVSGGASALVQDVSATLLKGGIGGIQESAVGLDNLTTHAEVLRRYLSLTARGVSKDLGSGVSLLLGVLSTQTYAQAIWSAKSTAAARRGALLGALLIPPLGAAGICVGMFMRAHYITQAELSALLAAGLPAPNLGVLASTVQVFPVFVSDHLPPLFAGVILGTLLIAVVGGGAGLSLGMATVLVKDIFKKLAPSKFADNVSELRGVRGTIGGVLLAAAAIAALVPGSTINDLGFLSMGLRGAVVFAPLTCALWLPGNIHPKSVLAAIVLSPLVVLLGQLLDIPIDPLFPGMAVSIFCCLLGYALQKRPLQRNLPHN